MNKAHELLKWASDVSQYDNEAATHLAKAVVHIAKAHQTGEFDVGDYAETWVCVDKLKRVVDTLIFFDNLNI